VSSTQSRVFLKKSRLGGQHLLDLGHGHCLELDAAEEPDGNRTCGVDLVFARGVILAEDHDLEPASNPSQNGSSS